MKSDQRAAERAAADPNKALPSKALPSAKAQAPWPDPKARQEMSDAELACETLGKHGKNADWKRTW